MTDLIKQIEARVDELSYDYRNNYYSDYSRLKTFDDILIAHKAGAQSLMPLIEYQLIQFENVLYVFTKNMAITDQLKNDLIETYRRQLLELLNKDLK